MIHSSGTLSVNNSSTQVTGSGTLWLSRLTAGCVIYIDGSDKAYYVAKVVSDTELQLVIPFEEANKSGVPYIAVDDFTLNYSFAYPRPNDVERATIVRRSLLDIDGLLGGFDARVSEVENPSNVYPASMEVTPSIGGVTLPTLHNLTLSNLRVNLGLPSVSILIGNPPDVITADASDVTADANTATADGWYIGSENLITADSNTVTIDSGSETIDGSTI